ncbi:MAG: hypothetical protein GY809_00280, partial [Planctomycetes bacterium]|nr:hypothetical protein [Planctomycetota bacterium]
MNLDKIVEEMQALACQPVVDIHAYRRAQREIIQSLADYAEYLMKTWDDPLPLPLPPPRPRLVWTNHCAHEI